MQQFNRDDRQQFDLVDTWSGGTGERRVVFTGTDNECMVWVHQHTSFSYHEALTRQGYVLMPVTTPA